LYLRNGRQPFALSEASPADLSSKGTMSWQPIAGGVALSGDLGYTYGAYQQQKDGKQNSGKGYYLNIWQRTPGKDWRIVLNVTNPASPEK
jgi:ketosteroid isomerase-like protein